MKKKIRVKGYSEDLTAQKEGVRYYIEGFGSIFIRRGGLSGWRKALKEAQEEVLGENYSYNYIDPNEEEKVNAKACADFIVVKLEDCVDADGQEIPDSRANIKSIFENPENYSLVEEVIMASHSKEYFLLEVVREEIDQLKKS